MMTRRKLLQLIPFGAAFAACRKAFAGEDDSGPGDDYEYAVTSSEVWPPDTWQINWRAWPAHGDMAVYRVNIRETAPE